MTQSGVLRCYRRSVSLVDIVIVAYNSSEALRECVEPLVADPELQVVIVDNASTDEGAAAVADLPVTVIALERNLGFGGGCNVGWRSGEAPFVLFLNPDARIDPQDVRRLVDVLAASTAGIAAPRILNEDGSVQHSQHRFPTLLSSWLQAVFLHRLFNQSAWAHEDVVAPESYERPGSPDWVGGACIALQRETLMRLDGFDDLFFMYCEDMDLCRRVRDFGLDVLFVPEATAWHAGGGSAPAPRRSEMKMRSRVLYARKHRARLIYVFFAAAFALGLVLRLALDPAHRAVHAHGLRGVALALLSLVGRA